MTVRPTYRWATRLGSGAVASATAVLFVWALQRLLHIADPHYARMILAGAIGGIVGLLGRLFIDEVAQQ